MKSTLICVGKIKDKYLIEGINEYLKRLSKYIDLNVVEVKDFNDTYIDAKILEGKEILKKIKNTDYVVGLTLDGKEFDSIKFSEYIEKIKNKYTNNIVFVIGGSLGFSDEVIERFNDKISLSKLTFTHQLTRLIFLEQLYRSFKILNNERYHK